MKSPEERGLNSEEPDCVTGRQQLCTHCFCYKAKMSHIIFQFLKCVDRTLIKYTGKFSVCITDEYHKL